MRREGKLENESAELRRRQSGSHLRHVLMMVGVVFIVILVVSFLLLRDELKPLLRQTGLAPAHKVQAAPSIEDEKIVPFVKIVLADTAVTWTALFQAMGKTYVKPKLVTFSSAVRSGCGLGDAQTGPFYCPADETIYVDLAYCREMRERYRSTAEFTEAYVIAHEVGHHVQKLLGLSDRVEASRGRVTDTQQNELTLDRELQADFLAGMWARKAQGKFSFITQADVEDTLHAASAMGDITLQQPAKGQVMPDPFTHGSARQRVKWFRKGFDSDDIRDGDTFRDSDL